MKIICEQIEKEKLIRTLASEHRCVGAAEKGNRCPYETCEECVEKNIEWEITDGEQE